jgi:hypothetical protein
VSLVPLERLLSARRSWTGRPSKDRAALVTVSADLRRPQQRQV